MEICKALARDPRVLVLDEATASLYRSQVDVVFDVVRQLRDEGTLVIFTSHRMGEIFEVCDRATVLRGGKVAGKVDVAETDEQQLVELMVGTRVETAEPPVERAGAQPGVLRVNHLHTDELEDVSLEVEAGEVLGLGGLAGQGQSDLLFALLGRRAGVMGR